MIWFTKLFLSLFFLLLPPLSHSHSHSHSQQLISISSSLSFSLSLFFSLSLLFHALGMSLCPCGMGCVLGAWVIKWLMGQVTKVFNGLLWLLVVSHTTMWSLLVYMVLSCMFDTCPFFCYVLIENLFVYKFMFS